jgi:hypothetical protein
MLPNPVRAVQKMPELTRRMRRRYGSWLCSAFRLADDLTAHLAEAQKVFSGDTPSLKATTGRTPRCDIAEIDDYAEAEIHMLGILVHGDNHFIVRGPEPDAPAAYALARHWSLIRIGASTPSELARWTISTREFRENLQWAVILPGEGPQNPEVTALLNEMTTRGVEVRSYRTPRADLPDSDDACTC